MTEQAFGPYRLVSLLGRGGMGEVWRAVDTRKDRVVALKVLGAWLGDDPLFVERFRREAELAARLRSPHIVPIHDYGEVDGRLYIDMALIDAPDLATLLGRSRLEPARVVGIVVQVARALAAAHEHRLVHRDVKPSNILVTTSADGDDHAYLIDFGIVRALGGTASQSGGVVGTPDYMAPECFAGGGDARSDVYSLGCVLYEALTGRKPFLAPHPFAFEAVHRHAAVPLPSADDGAASPALDAVVARALAKDPDERFPDAGALGLAARAALEATGDDPAPDGTTSAPPSTPTTGPGRRPVGRRGRAAAVTAVAVATALGLVGVGLVSQEPDPPGTSPAMQGVAAPMPPGVAVGVTVEGSPTFAAMTRRGRVVVGVKGDQPGLGLRDDGTGAYSGFDVEIARLVAARLGFGPDRIEYRAVPFADRERAIASGEVDYYVGSYGITDERKRHVGFAGPYLAVGQRLLVRGDETVITGKDTLRGRKVCAMAGSAALRRVDDRRLTDTNDVVGLPTPTRCVNQLLAGRVDAVTADDAILAGYAAQQPGRLKVVGDPFSADSYGIGLAPDDAALRATVDDILQAAATDGTWTRLYAGTLGPSGVPAQPPPVQRY